MQHFRFSRFIVWVAFFALLLASFVPQKAIAAGQVNYVALGDSLAAGQTPDRSFDIGYTDYISSTFSQEDNLISYTKKFATSGYTTQNVLDDLLNNKEVDGIKIQDVVKKAHLITLTVGANDLLKEASIDRTKGTVSMDPQKAMEVAAKVKVNLSSIVGTIKTLNPKAKVYVSGYYNAFPYLPADQQGVLKQLLAGFNAVIQQAALENGATFVSLDGIFDANPTLYLPNPKDIHPSLDGYKLIAEAFMKNFTKPPSYVDVPRSYWAYHEIFIVSDEKIMVGVSDTHFAPGEVITRADAAQVLFNILPFTKSIPANPGFSDVGTDHKAYMAIAKLTEAGVFAKSAKFNPDAPLTRAQMAKIISIAFKLKATRGETFLDIPKKYWAKEYIDALFASRVTIGYPNNLFKPELATSRAQFAAFVVRARSSVALE